MTFTDLPTVVVTSVIRSAHQRQSHGGVYLVNPAAGHAQQTLDWNDPDIDWSGRGGDRGLRGVAFGHGLTYLAAANEVFIYDTAWHRRGSISNPYLGSCHEICIHGDRLYLTSTTFDSVLEYDLASERFVVGHCLRYGAWRRWMKRRGACPKPTYRRFDPNRAGGPTRADTTHLNSVTVHDGSLFIGGTRMAHLLRIDGGRWPASHAVIPYWTHNARPFGDHVLINDTGEHRAALLDRAGNVERTFTLPRYDPAQLQQADLPADHARQAFARGLCVHEDRYLIVGSSPATVSVFDLLTAERLTSVNLTMDVRNAVHGLEVWPHAAVGSASSPTTPPEIAAA